MIIHDISVTGQALKCRAARLGVNCNRMLNGREPVRRPGLTAQSARILVDYVAFTEGRLRADHACGAGDNHAHGEDDDDDRTIKNALNGEKFGEGHDTASFSGDPRGNPRPSYVDSAKIVDI